MMAITTLMSRLKASLILLINSLKITTISTKLTLPTFSKTSHLYLLIDHLIKKMRRMSKIKRKLLTHKTQTAVRIKIKKTNI